MNRFNIGDQFNDLNGDKFTVRNVQSSPQGFNYTLNSFKGFSLTLPEKELVNSLQTNQLKWSFMTLRTSMTNKLSPKTF